MKFSLVRGQHEKSHARGVSQPGHSEFTERLSFSEKLLPTFPMKKGEG